MERGQPSTSHVCKLLKRVAKSGKPDEANWVKRIATGAVWPAERWCGQSEAAEAPRRLSPPASSAASNAARELFVAAADEVEALDV